MSAGPARDVDAIIVGSGPNGLAAAVVLARAGLSVLVLEAESTLGGGARTLDLGLAPGITHDLCSAVHPLAVASPFFRAFDLRSRGVELVTPDVSYGQPLDSRRAALAHRDLGRTVAGLGPDAPTWERFFRPLLAAPDAIVAAALGDKRSLPRLAGGLGGLYGYGVGARRDALSGLRTPASPRAADRLAAARALASFGLRVGGEGTPLWNLPWRTEQAKALLTGVATHAIGRQPSVTTAGTGILLAMLGHADGWPIPVGGSQAIANALLADLEAHGGETRTGVRVRSVEDLPPARAVLFDTTAEAAAAVLGDTLPARVGRGLQDLGHGPGAAKVDLVLDGPIPWGDPRLGDAGTVHVGGTRAEMAAAESQVVAGRMPARPVVLVSDPGRFDASRVVDGLRPVWAYAHVPADCPIDPTRFVLAQLERFAPGLRERIVAVRGTPASRMAEHNANLVGGDISGGRLGLARLVARPRWAWETKRLAGTSAYLCSAATTPGPGVHGMAGFYAARDVLAQQFGIREHVPLGV
ncbi:phytoene desaturase family protein [Brevibacterium yomogidense]|uniref:Phytoene dehydrogenase and related proteins n=1 Tax=Brevibacterium yomogidense TaxID=946573 RepID=A0A1X6WUE7_9MICO|nr:NAD(P)/FAD-dependent oxidoreductase [Brevibacterium yomogidense]SLM88799.1 Phytoene dehydrogenase and related proteins [Brevibacterium yomogidense]